MAAGRGDFPKRRSTRCSPVPQRAIADLRRGDDDFRGRQSHAEIVAQTGPHAGFGRPWFGARSRAGHGADRRPLALQCCLRPECGRGGRRRGCVGQGRLPAMSRHRRDRAATAASSRPVRACRKPGSIARRWRKPSAAGFPARRCRPGSTAPTRNARATASRSGRRRPKSTATPVLSADEIEALLDYLMAKIVGQ